MSEIIKIENLNKSFGNLQAVKNLSFSVERGELFAFLGVNGAGKSTTISIISGTLEKDGGTVTIDGKNIESDMAEICGAERKSRRRACKAQYLRVSAVRSSNKFQPCHAPF